MNYLLKFKFWPTVESFFASIVYPIDVCLTVHPSATRRMCCFARETSRNTFTYVVSNIINNCATFKSSTKQTERNVENCWKCWDAISNVETFRKRFIFLRNLIKPRRNWKSVRKWLEIYWTFTDKSQSVNSANKSTVEWKGFQFNADQPRHYLSVVLFSGQELLNQFIYYSFWSHALSPKR